MWFVFAEYCSCSGLANLIHRYTKQGYDQDYVFLECFEKSEPEHVREAISKYINLEKCSCAAVGELGEFCKGWIFTKEGHDCSQDAWLPA